ncbi:hypothetical protein [Streptomyces oryzae]|nr:hypothetical protein [Streptomyces oryzae]
MGRLVPFALFALFTLFTLCARRYFPRLSISRTPAPFEKSSAHV